MSAKYIKNEVLKNTMENIIDFSSVFKLNDLIDEMLPIPNVKFANLVIVLSSCIKVSYYRNSFSWPILPVN